MFARRKCVGLLQSVCVLLLAGATGHAQASLRLETLADGSRVFLDRNGRIVGILTAGNSTETIASLSAAPPQLPGWPALVGEVDSTPTVGDVDGDGTLEVVFASYDDNLYVLDTEGRDLVPGWPFRMVSGSGHSPSLADINGDGTLEIFMGSGKAYGLDHAGTSLPGWPKSGFGFVTMSIDDLNRHGGVEIVATDGAGRAYLWSGSGRISPGWPFQFPNVFASSNQGPALGNVDGFGAGEVVLPMDIKPSVYVLSLNGVEVSGFPITFEFGAREGVSLGDMDGDGAQDLVIQVRSGVRVLNGRGQPLPGWPQVAFHGNAPPTVGDIDNDGRLEIVWATPGGDAHVVAFNDDGTLLPGWPITVPSFSFNSQATLGDVDGDGQIDILIGGFTTSFSARGRIYAWHADGTLVRGFPFTVPDGKTILFSAITITDLDEDGDVELLVGAVTGLGGTSDGRVFAFDLDAEYDLKTMEWPTLGHDIRHTKRYELPGERIPMDVRLSPGMLVQETSEGKITARLEFPLDVEPGDVEFRIERLNRIRIPPLVGEQLGGSTSRDTQTLILQFEAAALANALETIPESPTGFVVVEIASEPPRQGRYLVGSDILRTSPRLLSGARIAFSSSPFDLGEVELGTENGARLSVLNLGNEPLFVRDLQVSGDGFRIQSFFPFFLDPGLARDISVFFEPQRIENFEGLLSVVSNARNEEVADVSLLGVGKPPLLAIGTAEGRELLQVTSAGSVFPFAASPLNVLDVEATDDGTYWLVGHNDHNVWEVDGSGVAAPIATQADGILSPTALSLDTEGRLLIANRGTRQILVLDGEAGVNLWADFPSGVTSPTGLAVLPTGEVAVCDAFLAKILAVSPDGSVRTFADETLSTNTRDCEVGPDGSLHVVYSSSSSGPLVLRYVADGSFEVVADSSDGLVSPWGIALDSTGRMYVTDVATKKVLRFDLDGKVEVFADVNPASPLGIAAAQ